MDMTRFGVSERTIARVEEWEREIEEKTVWKNEGVGETWTAGYGLEEFCNQVKMQSEREVKTSLS